ncbi:hypothetical protein RE428_18650 [Marinobacter nanhaiticus D15-8W]|nr:hypothetical protein RE428_18650 [Marinobacter nanhaiticus D15-8W]
MDTAARLKANTGLFSNAITIASLKERAWLALARWYSSSETLSPAVAAAEGMKFKTPDTMSTHNNSRFFIQYHPDYLTEMHKSAFSSLIPWRPYILTFKSV